MTDPSSKVTIKVAYVGVFFVKLYPHCSRCGVIHNQQPTEDDALRAGAAHVRERHPEIDGTPHYFQNDRRI